MKWDIATFQNNMSADFQKQVVFKVCQGGGVIKQRIARPNEGKSGGFRSIILYRQGEKAFFVFGFPKKNKDNIKIDEVRWFKKMAKSTFALSEDQLEKLIKTGDFRPVKCYE